MRKWIVFGFSFILWLLFSSAIYANPSLQEMVDQAAEHAVIQLEDKVYEGNLVINKPITIIGSGQTVIKGDGSGNVIMIKAPDVTLDRIRVTNSSFNRNTHEEYAAIKVFSNHNILKDLVIDHSYHGIYLSQVHGNMISGVTITGIGDEEIAGQGNGIHVYYSNNNQMIGNTIQQVRDGIFFDYAYHNEVVDNTIQNTRYGLHYMYSDNNAFYKNRFLFNIGGAVLMFSQNIKLHENDFSFNRGSRSFGLMLQSCDEIEVVGNQFIQNQRGLTIDQSNNNRFKKNLFVKNQVGIELWASSNEQIFTQNEFRKNAFSVISAGGNSKGVWSENGIGNRWGEKIPLLDLNQDGIGDQTIQVKSSMHKLIEKNELTYLFLTSPSITIYEKINGMMHRQQVMFEDKSPLISKRNVDVRYLGVIIIAGFILIGWILMRRRVTR